MRRLAGLGWPVPAAAEEPILVDGRTWCLFSWIPGAPRPSTNSSEERRARGRLLAQLHDSTALLVGMGQLRGFSRSDELIRDPKLVALVQEYERIYPDVGHIMRWHIDQALESFERIDLDRAETIVLHSDLAPWNLLFEGASLTGIIDLDGTHLNYRVADFANSWRGYQDEVIDGYQEIHKLTDLDWQLLIPVYWSWLFIGVKDAIKAMVSGKAPPNDFEWQIRHLMRREGLLGQRAGRYPGLKIVPETEAQTQDSSYLTSTACSRPSRGYRDRRTRDSYEAQCGEPWHLLVRCLPPLISVECGALA